MRVSLTARQSGWLIILALGLLLLLRALELRLPEMSRAVWQDEVHHNEPVLASPDMRALDERAVYRRMFQPKLDFWMRHDLWFPLFGVSERAMRLPSLIWGLCLVLLVYGVLVRFLGARMELRWAALLAFLASLWIVENPMQVQLAEEARHYSLISLASTLWCSVLLLYRGKPAWLLALASVLFANTHFFSLPLIAVGYLWQLAGALRERDYRAIGVHLLACAAVYGCTVYFNWVPFESLLTRPPGAVSAPLSDLSALSQLKAGFELWLSFARALGLPPATWLLWGAILIATFARRNGRWLPLLVAVCVVLPAVFLYLRLRSSYPYGDRYSSPFFGVGLVTLAAALEVGLNEWPRLESRLPARARRFALPLAALALTLLFSAPAVAYRLFADATNLRAVPANSSAYFRMYSALVAERRPLFVVQTHCYVNDIPSLYFRFILPAAGALPPGAIVDWGDVGCKGHAGPGPQTRKRLGGFLRRYARASALIAIDEKEKSCANRPAPELAPPLSYERIDVDEGCVWKISGVRSRAQLAAAASALGVEAARHFR